MKLLIEIDEHNKNVIDRFADGEGCDILPENIFTDLIESVENGTPIPNNATNGDVIKAMYSNIESRLDEKTGIMLIKWADGTMKTFKTIWWDAPYKGGK